ncbi:MAG: tRNA epoxyqueuosine(34) reductase QueG [Tepidisphaerales bacterium]
MLSTPLLVEALHARATALGFDLFGIAPAHDSEYAAYFRAWLAAGRHGQMEYLARRLAERVSPQTYFPGCRSVLCVAVNYHTPAAPPVAPHPADDPTAVPGRVARYAWGEDYHEPIKEKLHQLADHLRELAPDAETRCAVDTAPVAERELAARAGLGWIGKNTCLIHPRMGSWLLLGVVLTTLELPASKSLPPQGHCGSCTRCLDACPTDALHPDRPYQLDASQCIAYLTIEHRGEIPPTLAEAVGDWLFGCDICQDVCPFNRKAPSADLTANPFLTPRIPDGRVNARDVLGWTLERWHDFSRRTAIRRLGLPLFQRNAAVVVRNHDARQPACRPDDTAAGTPTPPPPAADGPG